MMRVEHAPALAPGIILGFGFRSKKIVPTSKRTNNRRKVLVVKLDEGGEQYGRGTNGQAAMAWLRQIDLAKVQEVFEQESGGSDVVEGEEVRCSKRRRENAGGAELCCDSAPGSGARQSVSPEPVESEGNARMEEAAIDEARSGKLRNCIDGPVEPLRLVLELEESPKQQQSDEILETKKKTAGRPPSRKDRLQARSVQHSFPRFQPPGADLSSRPLFKEHKMKVNIQLTKSEIEADLIAIMGGRRQPRRNAVIKRVRNVNRHFGILGFGRAFFEHGIKS